MDIQGKRALVTGGAHRIGRGIVERLGREGVSVAIHYGNSESEAAELAQGIEKFGVKAVAIGARLDGALANYDWLVDKAVSELGGIDILINSAARFEPRVIEETDEWNWHQHMDTNLKAPFFLSKYFAKVSQGKGHIINITDARYLRPKLEQSAYILSKSAVASMTEMLAAGLAPDIQVNCLALGAILPPRGKGEKYMKKLAQVLPLRRSGNIDEVGRAVLFLLSSEFITGEIVFVDGGLHL